MGGVLVVLGCIGLWLWHICADDTRELACVETRAWAKSVHVWRFGIAIGNERISPQASLGASSASVDCGLCGRTSQQARESDCEVLRSDL